MKKSIFKKLVLLILCVSLFLPGVSGVVLAKGETFSEDDLVTKVSPVLQHNNIVESNSIKASIDKLEEDIEEPDKVDKSELEYILYEALMIQIDSDKYTDESYTKFEEALDKAKEIYLDPEASQDQVNEVLKELREAIDNLEEKEIEEPDKVDKSELEALLNELESIKENLDKYTEESVKKLEEVENRALETYRDPSAGQEQVDKVVKELREAIDNLKEKPTGGSTEVDKSELDYIFYEALMIQSDSDKYTEESYAKFEEALDKAKEIYLDPEASQNQVNEVVKELREAIDNLEEKEIEEPDKVDKSELEDLLNELESIKENLDKYTEASVKKLEEVENRALETYRDPSAGQEQVDKVTKELREAIDNLEEKDIKKASR